MQYLIRGLDGWTSSLWTLALLAVLAALIARLPEPFGQTIRLFNGGVIILMLVVVIRRAAKIAEETQGLLAQFHVDLHAHRQEILKGFEDRRKSDYKELLERTERLSQALAVQAAESVKEEIGSRHKMLNEKLDKITEQLAPKSNGDT